MCVCVRARARVCVCMCLRARPCACVCLRLCVPMFVHVHSRTILFALPLPYSVALAMAGKWIFLGCTVLLTLSALTSGTLSVCYIIAPSIGLCKCRVQANCTQRHLTYSAMLAAQHSVTAVACAVHTPLDTSTSF